MKAILIDYDKIIDNKLHKNLIEKINIPPNSSYKRGLMLIINEKCYDKLCSLSLGNNKLNFLNSKEFTDSINNHCYILYDSRRNLCQIKICDFYKELNAIISAIHSDINKNTIVWGYTELNSNDERIAHIVENGFDYPYITNKTPFNETIPHSLAMVYNHKSRNNKKQTKLEAEYVLQQYGNDSCMIHCKFSNKAIKFLKKTSTMGYTKNSDSTVTQKELSGELHIESIIKGPIFIIDVNHKSVKPGKEEGVSVSPTRYNFHSHPEEAYVRHSVHKAWPSVIDYLGMLKLGNNTIFHTVTTIEGLYIISFHKDWVNDLKKIDKKFIEKNFHIDHREKYTPFEYTKVINNIKYQNKHIFVVKFLPWGSASSIFGVNYSKNGINCIVSDEISPIVEKY